MKTLKDYIDWTLELFKKEQKPAEHSKQVEENTNAHQTTENTTKPKRGRKPKPKI